jgi:hypothetical protein
LHANKGAAAISTQSWLATRRGANTLRAQVDIRDDLVEPVRQSTLRYGDHDIDAGTLGSYRRERSRVGRATAKQFISHSALRPV